MSKRADLGSFIASKSNAAPAPLELPTQADVVVKMIPRREAPSVKAPAPKPEVPEETVLLNTRVPASFRLELKLYAATMGKDMREVVMEGVELHRQKHAKKS